MNSSAILLAIGVAAILAVVIAPALVESALAARKELTTCPSGNPCQGQSGAHNPNRETCHSNSPNAAEQRCVG